MNRAAIAIGLITATSTAGAGAYAALSAQSQLFGSIMIAPRCPKELALTYDDGPNDLATERLLDVLACHNIRATFFMIGSFVRQRPAIARAVAAAGHLIGNHTMTHPWLAWQSAPRIRQELGDCNAALEDTLGQPVHFFRPPHGARRPFVLRAARELGLTAVNWNIIAGDWQPNVTSTVILNRLERAIGRNRRCGLASNIVLHDGGNLGIGQNRMPTIEATAQLLDLCRSTSTIFVTPEEWITSGARGSGTTI
jgi:peptidoglycan/xylan/chitin deacetylase (PgdA/CDA1 family)